MSSKGEEESKRQKEENCCLSRRQIFKLSAAAGAGILLARNWQASPASAQPVCPLGGTLPAAPTVRKFKDPLPLLQAIAPYKQHDGADYYTVSIEEASLQFHSEMPETPLWTYNGTVPGPTFLAKRGRQIVVTFTNNLPAGAYSPGGCPDPMVMGAAVGETNVPSPTSLADPLTVVHLHGSDSAPQFDGFPYDRIPPGASFTHTYPNDQPPTTLWYHDHSMGLTRINVYAGLAGMYIIRDDRERDLHLPSGNFEIPLIIQDKAFNSDGTLFQYFPWQPELFANTIAVNGRLWPKLQVTRGKYRFRILNASNARFFNLYLNPPSPATAPADFIQIGCDGGYLAAPVAVTPQSYTFNDVYAGGAPSTIVRKLLIAPAERVDVIVDFSRYAVGTIVTLQNDAPGPFPGGLVDPALADVMQFEVVAGPAHTHKLPAKLIAPPVIRKQDVVKTRNMALVDWGFLVTAGTGGGPIGTPPPLYPYPTLLLNNLRFNDPLTECPVAGSTEIWNLINFAPDTHPIHLHQVQYKVLGRAPFDALAYANAFLVGQGGSFPPPDPTTFLTGPFQPPDPNETGPKDTVRANPGEVTQILVKWNQRRGKFLWHCHILDHEDNEMMRRLLVC